ncbi:Crp/Fnr family transcriptional regulator [Chitinophaga parva]|uniref:Crp/Fnr family transcriptional regulator n=1 Tax=Chitinophaga parva TaxID=2169414 RepID=A0A2T7BCB8_9BACT|nr:Crp/Fnr family transcriptional regulator [Chitinophaga parva]PUZ22715.1 Crp/Fnr family transcriptional regulator [Chitinophaga parva]
MHPLLKQYVAGRIALTPDQEALVDQCFVPRHTVRGEILVQAGTVARHLYFVAKGCLRIFLTNEAGEESTRFLVFEGSMGTAFPSFILRQPSAAAVQTPEPSELLQLSYENRVRLQQEIPGWETLDRIGVELAYIDAIRRIEQLISADSRERYRLLMEEHPEMIKRLPSRIIADYLGITPETLSRLKSKR